MYKGENKNGLVSFGSENGNFDFGNTFGSVDEFGFDRVSTRNELTHALDDGQVERAISGEQLRYDEKTTHTDIDVKNNDEIIWSAISSDDVKKTGEIGKAVHGLANKIIIDNIDDPAKLNDEINKLSRKLVGEDGVLSGYGEVRHG